MLDLAYNNKEKYATLLDMFQSKEHVISDASAYGDDFNMFFLHWCELRRVRFSFFVFGYGTTGIVQPEMIASFIKSNGSTLKTLGVHADSSGSWWDMIGTECNHLEEFEVEVLADLDGAVLTQILRQNCSTLRKVDLMIDDFQASLPTECSFPNLVEFHSRAEVKLNGISEWLVQCPNLRRFAIDVRTHNMPRLLQSISEHCKHICSINLLQLDNDSVAGIIRHCPEGPALHLMFDPEATETTIVNCFLRLKNVQSATFLASAQLSDGCLDALRQFCAPTLRKLSINSCEGVTFTSLLALVKECKKLSILYLNNGPVMTAKQLSTLVSVCPTLTRLSLIAPYKVDNAVLASIATHCKILTFLNIENGMTDHAYTLKGLKTLLQGCSQLTTVCLGGAYSNVISCKKSAELKALYPSVSIEREVSAGYEVDDSDEIQ